ncbi:MAG: patatin-like phospholipase family protein [Pirellulales bacterium]|nr:patatin-like phospholipase family protein [Pirellulales bacterium]
MWKNPTLIPRHGCVASVLVLCLLMGGCARKRSNCAPVTLLKPETVVDLSATSAPRGAVESEVFVELTAPLRKHFADSMNGPHAAGRKRLNVLALSGGGSLGAFTAGVLNGWTANGTRPTFDVVTGTSTGALIAPLAFLGPCHDARIRELYTNVTSDDIYRKRMKPAVLWSDSAASSEPLERMIANNMDQRMLYAVASAHCQGRHLFIGTTNLDTGRLVIWDMGAIAASGRPGSLELFRKIILASSSVPGFFPPVPIEICVNGRRYTELHADGGTTSQVFLRGSMLDLNPEEIRAGHKPLLGSRVYIIIAGKSFPDPKCLKLHALSIAPAALSALTSAQTRNDVVRIFTLSLLTGMEFRLAAVPQEFPVGEDSMEFDTHLMRRLYNEGYRMARCGRAWRKSPPVVDPSEQSVPREGTNFLDLSGCVR